MSVRLYADEYRCAIYEEAPGGGDPIDPNSQMNRPVLDPITWIDNIYFHSDLNYYRIAAQNLNVVINHASVAGLTTQAGNGAGDTSDIVTYAGQIATTSHLLIDHNLGYIPKFFCIYDGKLIPHGTPVQSVGNGQIRFVTAYATTTQIRLFETASSTENALPAITKTYQVIVFHDATADLDYPMLDLHPGVAVFGQGKFRGENPHLRADGLGDVQWPIATERAAGIRNGGLRAYYPNGGYVDFLYYNGSLAAPDYIITSAGI